MRHHMYYFILPIAVAFVLVHCTVTTLAQPASSPSPTNVTRILDKAGHYTTLVKLLGLTHIDDQLNGLLNDSNQGMTIFAPTDDAFSSLPSGAINSLNSEQKTELVQYHVIPIFFTLSQFQTASNPMNTQAGGTDEDEFPLNITSTRRSVEISTGVVNASVAGTVYLDSQLAVYRVDKVLLPQKIFGSMVLAMEPAPSKPEKKAFSADGTRTVDVCVAMHGVILALVAVFVL